MRIRLREGIFLAILMLIPLGAWQFVFRPQNAENARIRTEIQARQAKLSELNQTVATIGDLRVEIAQLTEAINYFQSKLPNEKEIDKILQDIWHLAEDNNLHTASIRTLDRSGRDMFLSADASQGEQPIAVHLTGNFEGFYSFLLALENQARIMRIRKMLLKTSNDSPDGNIDAEFEMSIFFEHDSEETPWPQGTRT